MSLRKANIAWSANQVSKMIVNGKITFDNVVQRSYVWEVSRRTKFIESLILGYPVPPHLCKKRR